jgi:hypothetical protein
MQIKRRCQLRLTFVPAVRSVKSSVVPAGTATFDKVIVEQEVLDLRTLAAPVEPENMHEAARLSKVAGAANATDERRAAPARAMKEGMISRSFQREVKMERKSEA